MSKKKLEANEFGAFAEEKAVMEYIKKGYTILERNYHSGKSEIDIIAQTDNCLVLVEVKARRGEGEAMAAVKPDKRRRMVKVADNYLRKLTGDYDYRFDIVAVTGDMNNYKIEILEDAFVSADMF